MTDFKKKKTKKPPKGRTTPIKLTREDYLKKIFSDIEILDDENVSYHSIDAPYVIMKAISRINYLSSGFPQEFYIDAVENFYAICRPFDTSSTMRDAILEISTRDTNRINLEKNPIKRKELYLRTRKEYSRKKFEIMMRFLGQKGLFGQMAQRQAKYLPDEERKSRKYELVEEEYDKD